MIKDLHIIILGRVLQIVITLISMRILTALLSPKEVGNYYLLLAIIAFYNLVLLNPPGMYFSRHLLQWKQNKQLLNALGIFMLWMVLVAIIALIGSLWVYHYFGYIEKFDLDLFLIYILGSILLSTLHRNVMFGSNTLGFRNDFVKYLLSTLLLGLIFSATIVHFFYPYALGWLMGVLLSEFFMVFIIFRFFIQGNRLSLKKIKSIFRKEKIKSIFFFTFPIGLTTFLMWGQTISYRFLVDSMYSAEILAYIAVGLGVAGSVFGSVESIVMQYYNPIFLKKILGASKEKRAEAWNNIAHFVVPVYVLTFFFTLALSEVLINILVDHKFHSAYVYMMIGAGLEFLRVMSNLLNSVAQSEYKTKATVFPYFIGFSISIGVLLSVNFEERYYMIPIVLTLAYLFVFLLMYRNMKNILQIKYDVNWIKLFIWSLPFGILFLIDIDYLNIWYNIILLVVFGIYFLIATWQNITNIGKEV